MGPRLSGPRGAPLARDWRLFTSTEPSRNSSAKTAAPPLLRLTWLAPVRSHPTARRARQSARSRGRRWLEVVGARAGGWGRTLNARRGRVRPRASRPWRGEGACACAQERAEAGAPQASESSAGRESVNQIFGKAELCFFGMK